MASHIVNLFAKNPTFIDCCIPVNVLRNLSINHYSHDCYNEHGQQPDLKKMLILKVVIQFYAKSIP